MKGGTAEEYLRHAAVKRSSNMGASGVTVMVESGCGIFSCPKKMFRFGGRRAHDQAVRSYQENICGIFCDWRHDHRIDAGALGCAGFRQIDTTGAESIYGPSSDAADLSDANG